MALRSPFCFVWVFRVLPENRFDFVAGLKVRNLGFRPEGPYSELNKVCVGMAE